MKSIRAYLDRIEGKFGVLLLGDKEQQRVDFPLAFLPKGIKEGTVLTLNFVRDKDEEEATYRAVEDLRGRLMHHGGPAHDDYED